MRTLTSTLAIIALCVGTLPAHAQQEAETDTSEKATTVVQVTLQSKFASKDRNGGIELPEQLTKRLSNQESLARLEMESDGKRIDLSAHFAFESMGAFRKWQDTEETREIIGWLEGHNGSTRLAMQLTKENP